MTITVPGKRHYEINSFFDFLPRNRNTFSKLLFEYHAEIKKQLCGTFSRKLTQSCVHYKWRKDFLSPPAILKGNLSLKPENFAVK